MGACMAVAGTTRTDFSGSAEYMGGRDGKTRALRRHYGAFAGRMGEAQSALVIINGDYVSVAPRSRDSAGVLARAFDRHQLEGAEPTEAQHLDRERLADAAVVEQADEIVDAGDA